MRDDHQHSSAEKDNAERKHENLKPECYGTIGSSEVRDASINSAKRCGTPKLECRITDQRYASYPGPDWHS